MQVIAPMNANEKDITTLFPEVCFSRFSISLYVSPLDDFGPWEAKGFEPEATFLEKIKAIDGVSMVETQTITNMEVS